MLRYLDLTHIKLHSILDETFSDSKHQISVFQVNMSVVQLDVTHEKGSEHFTAFYSLGGYSVLKYWTKE